MAKIDTKKSEHGASIDQRIAKQLKLKSIDRAECFHIDGVTYVTMEFIAKLYGVSRRTVANWMSKEENPLVPDIKATTKADGSNLFKLFNLVEYHDKYIQDVNKKIFAHKPDYLNQSDLPDEQCDFPELERRKKLHEVTKIQLQNKELQGLLVRAEDLDKAMAEQAVIHKTQFLDDIDNLPTALARLDEKQIHQFLLHHYEKHIKNLNSLIRKEFDNKEKIYEIVNRLLREANQE